MNTSQALVVAAVVVGTTEAKQIKTGHAPAFKPVLGGFMLGLFLIALGAANDHIANLFGVLIVVSAILLNGIPILTK